MASPEGRSVLSEYRPDLVARWMIGAAYTYAEANPMFNIDPTGLTSKEGETCYWACAGAFAATESSAAGLCTLTGPGWGHAMVTAQPVCQAQWPSALIIATQKKKTDVPAGPGGEEARRQKGVRNDERPFWMVSGA